jgi:anthranilate phosphoribosyltransferase
VVLNAGAALAVHRADDLPLDDALAAGILRATDAIDSGAARETLERWVLASAT